MYYFNFITYKDIFYFDIMFFYNSLQVQTIFLILIFPIILLKFPTIKEIILSVINNRESNNQFELLLLYYKIFNKCVKNFIENVYPIKMKIKNYIPKF